MFGLINRDNLPSRVVDEFEHLFGRLRAMWLAEHNEDGTHRISTTPGNIPIGGAIEWYTNTAPSGFLLCDGAAISRSTYKPLFDVIGTTFGAGDGTTTFNVPDHRGRFGLGKAAAGTGSTLASTGGALDHTHAGPSHTHTFSTNSTGAHTHNMGSHTHTYSGTTSIPSDSRALDPAGGSFTSSEVHTHTFSGTTSGPSTNTTSSDGNHSHTGTTDAGGTGNTGGSNPAYLVVNFIIFTGVV